MGSCLKALSIDFETRSQIDLPKQGAYRYAEDPSTDVWCMAWAFDGEEPEIWTPKDAGEHSDDCALGLGGACDCSYGLLPARVERHIVMGGEVRAWNAQFERLIWREIMVKRYGAPEIAMEQFVCSAAEAAAMSLPRNLDDASRVTGVAHKKDGEGYALMLRMSRPREVFEDGTVVWWDEAGSRILAERKRWTAKHLEKDLADVRSKHERLYTYCKQDVRTEHAIAGALRRLTAREREIYLLDQRVNDRGVYIDRELVVAAKEVVTEGVERADAVLLELTRGAVTGVTKTAELRKWVQSQGVETDSIAKPAVAELLESDLSQDVRLALELRSSAGKSSTAKLDAMLAMVCADGRVKGNLLYHAAGTGRWGGRGVQMQNFPRPEECLGNPEAYIQWVLERKYDLLDLVDNPVSIVSSMLRSMVAAAPGNDLLAGDYSAIEARVLNWLAGQDDVTESFRAMDAGDKSKHPYKRMAVAMGRAATPMDVIKGSIAYQAGKAAELGCGFGMGWKKFITAAWDVYQVRVNDEESKVAVDAYRGTHPMVVDLWYDANRACITAVENPGVVQTFGALKNLKAVKAGAYLYIILPSGRPLAYAAPSVVMEPPPWGGEDRPSLHFWGIDGFSKKWGEMRLYGGLIVENIVQAVARDLLAEAMLRLESRGYPPVLSVHDENVSEVPKDFGDLKEFESIMAELPTWAQGLPVAVEGWRGERYRK